MALLANQLLDPRSLSGVNGRMELPPFLGAQNHPGLAPQASATEEDTRKNRKYPCPLCGKRFRFNSILSLHMRTHTGEKPFKCPYCEHRAAQKGNLKIHLRTHKQGILGKGRGGRVREENRLLHELEERGAILRDRQIRGGGPSSRPPRSPQPQPLLPQTTELLANPPLPPPLAPSGPAADARPSLSPSSPNKTPVPKEHTPQTPPSSSSSSGFRCSFCKGKFRKQQELERHIRILHKPYKCTLCDYAASQEEQLISHVETTHIASESAAAGGSRPAPGGGAAGRRPGGGGEFPCEVCGQTFSQAWFLKGHMRKHKDSFEHCCQICGRRFKEPWFLKNHMKVHLNKLQAAKSSEPPGSGGAVDAAVAVGNAAAAPPLDPRANLYSRYISDLHGRLLSGAGRAGQPDYQHILSAVAVEMKVKEMLGRMLAQGHAPPPEGESGGRPARAQQALEDGEGRRMLAQGQDPLLGLGGLLRPLSSSSGGVEYLQVAPGDRDTLSNGAGPGYPRWQLLAPGLAHLEQVYTPNDDQRHRYRSERRVRADERRACDEERRARVADPESEPADDPGATGLSRALPQGQAGTSSSHTGDPQEEPPPDPSPAPGEQAYRCPLPTSDHPSDRPSDHPSNYPSDRPSNYPGIPPTSLGYPLERYRPHWQENGDPPTPQTPSPRAKAARDRSPRAGTPRPRLGAPSPGLSPGPRCLFTGQEARDDDGARINPDGAVVLGNREAGGETDAGQGDSGVTVAGRGSQQEPLDLSLRPDWGGAGVQPDKGPEAGSQGYAGPPSEPSIPLPPQTAPPQRDPGTDPRHPPEPEGYGGPGPHDHKPPGRDDEEAAPERPETAAAAGREDGDVYRWEIGAGDPELMTGGEATRPGVEGPGRWGRGAAQLPLLSPPTGGELDPERAGPLQNQNQNQNHNHRNLLAVLRSSGGHALMAPAVSLNGGGGGGVPRVHRTDRKPFQCRFCPYHSSQKGNLKTHVLCVHRQPFDSSLYPDRRLRRGAPPTNHHRGTTRDGPYPPPPSMLGDPPAPGRDMAMTSLCGT